jgi:hypothetical protein
MLRSLSRVLGYSSVLALFWACSSDGDDGPAPSTAGKGGASGKGGAAGAGGSQNGKAGGGHGGQEGGSAGEAEPAGGEAGAGEAAGQGGGGAGGEAGASGEAGSGGSSGDGGSAGDAGAAGQGGAQGDASGAACLACASGCEEQLARCEESPLCEPWLTCVRACGSSSCVGECDADYGAAPIAIDELYACLCASDCETECSVADTCDKHCVESNGLPALTSTAPALLSDTGLYVEEGDAWLIRPGVRTFEPEYELWADGAVKQRYIYLPTCKPIDTSDMDHWRFPVGTRVWKQFTRDGVRVETRMLARYGTGVADWLMVSYQWPLPASAGAAFDPRTAALAPEAGLDNANGTPHRIPSRGECTQCHNALSERVLGFSAIQLSYPASAATAGDLTFTELADLGVLSDAPVRTGYDPPGDEVAQPALGYLHANCGNCHNETGTFTQSPSLWLRLLVGQTTVESTHAYTTAVGRNTGNPNFSTYKRIAAHHAELSSTVLRMQRNPSTGEILPMPPIGRKLPDTGGISTVSAWINSLPE